MEISMQGVVKYEDFGAAGDGVADDLPAICAAHEYANAKDLPVIGTPGVTYHLGRRALTALIATDTDWNTSRFTIDDRDVENHQKPLFKVISRMEPEKLEIPRLSRDQRQLDVYPERDCHVVVESDRKMVYIRKGLNQSNGCPQSDCFILRKDGAIEGMIDWEYAEFSSVTARPIDAQTLTLRGGIFTTFANRMKQEVGYNYWARGIEIQRSNTVIDGLTHYVVGETEFGHPYRGFLDVRNSAYIIIRNVFATGHKTYSTIGSAGEPVRMGSYDLHANRVVDLKILRTRMNHICDTSRWGVIATNFCKNILLEDCTLSRMDTHMGVSGTYTLRRCELGYMGFNAIGRGTLTLEDATFYGNSFINLRGDYGSTWDGEILIRNCKWTPVSGEAFEYRVISMVNDGSHDFGYPCSMPTRVTIEGLFVDDTIHPEEYSGLQIFQDPEASPVENPPFPYRRCKQVEIQGLTTASGKKPLVSLNPGIQRETILIEKK